MAVSQSSEALRRPRNLLRMSVILVALISFVLAYIGLGQYAHLRGSGFMGHRAIDLLYYDFQLFVLGADPLQQPGPYPPLLEIARFAAPATTLYALIETVRLLFAVELSRWRARRAHGHAIVCGDSAFADALTRRLQADHVDVIEIRTEVDEFVTAGEPLRILGDARDPRVLRAAGIDHADAVYAVAEGSATNAAIALAVSRTRPPGPVPLPVYSHIPDPDLCATFQATFLGQPQPGAVRLDFFNVNHIAARRLFTDEPLAAVEGHPPHLLVVGTTGFGAAVVVAAARNWRVSRPDRRLLPLMLVGAGAGGVVADLAQRYPFLADVCDFTPKDTDLIPLLTSGEIDRPPDRVLVCYPDEEYALKSAMAAERLWRGRLHSIVVRLDTLAAFLDDGSSPGGVTSPLDAGSGVLRAFGVVGAACDPALIGEDLVERLARIIHDRYRQGRRQSGEWQPDDPSLQPWDRLSARLRQANRAQAEDIGRKLAHVSCVISPRFGRDGDAVLTETDIEALARQEHERWCHEYERAGWHYSPDRSEEKKSHPGLRPWQLLPEHFQRRNYDAVRELSDILGDAGFRIVRG